MVEHLVSRKVFMWDTRTWTKLIAYCGFAFSLYLLMDSMENIFEQIVLQIDEDHRVHDKTTTNKGLGSDYSEPIVFLFGALTEFAVSICLLVGVYQEKPCCLLLWLIATGIPVALACILICVIFYLAGVYAILLFLLVLSIPLGIVIFLMWIVAVYRNEIIEQQRSNSQIPFVQFQTPAQV